MQEKWDFVKSRKKISSAPGWPMFVSITISFKELPSSLKHPYDFKEMNGSSLKGIVMVCTYGAEVRNGNCIFIVYVGREESKGVEGVF